MKIYCEHLEEELKDCKENERLHEQKLALVRLTYDQQIEVFDGGFRTSGLNYRMQGSRRQVRAKDQPTREEAL